VKIPPETKHLYLNLPKKVNFHIPEGRYQAKIIGIKKIDASDQSLKSARLKFVLEVQVPTLPKMQNLANAEFKCDLGEGSELRALLIRFLGKEVVEEAAGSQLDIQALENREVTIEVEHIITNRRHEYEYPLVRVSGIQPAKTNPEKGELTAEN